MTQALPQSNRDNQHAQGFSPSEDLAPSATSNVSAQQEPAYLGYDRQRRLRLLRLLLPVVATILTFGGIFFAGSLLYTLAVSPNVLIGITGPVLLVECVVIILLAALGWLGMFFLRRDRLQFATGAMIAIVGIGFPFLTVLRGLTVGLDAIGLVQFMVFGVILLLVGMLGTRRLILGATLILNGITILLVLAAPGQSVAFGSVQQMSVLVTAVIFEWLFAGFILAQWDTYQQSMRELGAAYEQTRQIETLKDQFITHVNHELRTPIMTLGGYVELLHTSRRDMNEEDQNMALAQANQTSRGLVNLLESILDIRRIDERVVATPEVVDVYHTFETALALIDPREGGITGRDLHVDIPADLAIWGEPLRLQQILTNLLSNAIKYSPPGTPIIVQATTLATPTRVSLSRLQSAAPPAQVEIRIRDFGLGIPPDQSSVLFHRFVRLPRDLGSQVTGNGLGLYLCRVFAEAMGGDIRVESSGLPGEGSCFILRLPAAGSSERSQSQQSRDVDALQSEQQAPRNNKEPPPLQPAPLSVGEHARNFVASDLHVRRIALEDYRGRRLFLAFLRFAGCPFCGLRAHELTIQYPNFQEEGLDVVVVIESARAHALEQQILLDAPFPIIPDPTGALYRLYGATTSQRGLQIALRDRKEEYADAQRRGFDGLANGGPAHGDGVLDRLPAEFLIGQDLRIELAHYGKDIGDFMPLEMVTRHLQQSLLRR